MAHRLPAFLAAVDGDAIALVGDTFTLCQPIGDRRHPPQQTGLLFPDVGQGSNMLHRYHNHMNRRLRVNVTKSDYFIVAVEVVGRYFTGHNLAEYTVHRLPLTAVGRLSLLKDVATLGVVAHNRRETLHFQAPYRLSTQVFISDYLGALD